MRRPMALAVMFLLAAPALAGPFGRSQPPPVYGLALTPGDVVGPLKALSLDGHDTVVDWSAAKLTLVNFWATWCVPCRQEMPELQAIQAAHSDEGLRVVGVVVQDRATGTEIVDAAQQLKIDYLLLWGGSEVDMAWHGIGIVPTTYLVDPKGKILRKYVGTTPEQIAALKKDIVDILAGRPLGAPYLPPPDPAPAAPVKR